MRIRICAVGRLRGGPAAELVADWVHRFDRTGRALGLGPLDIVEIDDRKGGGPIGQAALLLKAIPEGSAICALDERGEMSASPELAAMIGRWRDAGRPAATFLIGGADGLDARLKTGADTVLSFGPMVWPHMLARAMLAEQLYRAATILAGTPYHRS